MIGRLPVLQCFAGFTGLSKGSTGIFPLKGFVCRVGEVEVEVDVKEKAEEEEEEE